MARLIRFATIGIAGGLCAALAVSGCTPARKGNLLDIATAWRLVSYDSCAEAVDGLRAAAKAAVGPYGFGDGTVFAGDDIAGPPVAPALEAGPDAAGRAPLEQKIPSGGDGYSKTNTHEAAADEPDLVKTDGQRIVIVSSGRLRVVDAATRELVGSLDLSGAGSGVKPYGPPTSLLLAGDHALVLWDRPYYVLDALEGLTDRAGPPETSFGPQFALVSLAHPLRVLSRLSIDGSLVDARQVGSLARVVVRSAPRIDFPPWPDSTADQRIEKNRAIIDAAQLSDWLPRIEVTSASGLTTTTEIACEDISRPKVYTGANLLTVLTIDIAADHLDATMPVTVAADGETVYSNGSSLYVTNDRAWWPDRWPADLPVAPPIPVPALPGDTAEQGETPKLSGDAGAAAIAEVVAPADQTADLIEEPKAPEVDRATASRLVLPMTEVYKFDISSAGKPKFVAGGAVDGYLLNQYAMSEWDGYLRVATTTGGQPARFGGEVVPTSSGVYVLEQQGPNLAVVGAITGLGQGERIYSVRFVGPVGYVVTFRQTDPLYTIDLHNPKRPAVRGVLKIPGYSAYLHPAGPDRLIGVGQHATNQGQVTGTQISLFDVGDLDKPKRLSAYTLSAAYSQAEYDPHAFLYWAPESLLVVPIEQSGARRDIRPGGGALLLRVGDSDITEVGFLTHPAAEWARSYGRTRILRSLVIGSTLWTLSDSGLMATDLPTLRRQAWIPFDAD